MLLKLSSVLLFATLSAIDCRLLANSAVPNNEVNSGKVGANQIPYGRQTDQGDNQIIVAETQQERPVTIEKKVVRIPDKTLINRQITYTTGYGFPFARSYPGYIAPSYPSIGGFANPVYSSVGFYPGYTSSSYFVYPGVSQDFTYHSGFVPYIAYPYANYFNRYPYQPTVNKEIIDININIADEDCEAQPQTTVVKTDIPQTRTISIVPTTNQQRIQSSQTKKSVAKKTTQTQGKANTLVDGKTVPKISSSKDFQKTQKTEAFSTNTNTKVGIQQVKQNIKGGNHGTHSGQVYTDSTSYQNNGNEDKSNAVDHKYAKTSQNNIGNSKQLVESNNNEKRNSANFNNSNPDNSGAPRHIQKYNVQKKSEFKKETEENEENNNEKFTLKKHYDDGGQSELRSFSKDNNKKSEKSDEFNKSSLNEKKTIRHY